MNTFSQVAIPALIAGSVGLIWLLFRTLSLYPAPPVERAWVRRRARRLIRPTSIRKRWELSFTRNRARLLQQLQFLPLAAPALAFLPIPLAFGLFAEEQAASGYLEILWQVIAAALGLSVAMVAFAFQAFVATGQRHHGGSLREFASETLLLAVLNLGIGCLITTGLVLFGWGEDAPGGWSAFTAAGLSVMTLLGLPFVFWRTVTAIDPSRLHSARKRRLRISVSRSINQQVTNLAANEIVREWAKQQSIPRHPHGVGFARAGHILVKSKSQGHLDDIALGVLARVAQRSRSRRDSGLAIFAELDSSVASGNDLCAVGGNTPKPDVWRCRRAMRIRKGVLPDDELVEQLDELHDDALVAIHDGRPKDYSKVAELYEEILLAFPEASAVYNLTFTAALAGGQALRITPLHQITRHLFEEMDEAARGSSRELAFDIAGLPIRVAGRAREMQAHALVAEMMRLYPALYTSAKAAE